MACIWARRACQSHITRFTVHTHHKMSSATTSSVMCDPTVFSHADLHLHTARPTTSSARRPQGANWRPDWVLRAGSTPGMARIMARMALEDNRSRRRQSPNLPDQPLTKSSQPAAPRRHLHVEHSSSPAVTAEVRRALHRRLPPVDLGQWPLPKQPTQVTCSIATYHLHPFHPHGSGYPNYGGR